MLRARRRTGFTEVVNVVRRVVQYICIPARPAVAMAGAEQADDCKRCTRTVLLGGRGAAGAVRGGARGVRVKGMRLWRPPRLPAFPSLSPLRRIMYSLDYPEPPTEAAIAHARAQLVSYGHDAKALERQLQDARDALARIVDERQCTIREMERELAALEDKLAHAKAYVSPFKRLPHELLRHIFTYVFEDSATSAWILSAVCMLWRRLALSMPKLWSKVCPSPPQLPPRCSSYDPRLLLRPSRSQSPPFGQHSYRSCSVRSPPPLHAR